MQHKAIAMMSGGLDSSLAVQILHDLGIALIGVHFTGPFCMCNRGSGGCIHFAGKEADRLGIPFKTLALGKEYLDIVISPAHGYGSGMNPCMDCRILMLRRARELMEAEGADFVVTGEVVGQRPMSQLKDKLRLIEKEAGLERLIVRPLSAKQLPETIPEQRGWVPRVRLLALHGRSRREQMSLAETLAIGDYPCPAGGCLLTDKHFAARLRDHLEHGKLEMSDIALLKVGRHFRLSDGSKLVVGRDQGENERIESLARETDFVFVPENVVGPTALLRTANGDPSDPTLAAHITSGYCDGDGEVAFTCRTSHGEQSVRTQRSTRQEFKALKIEPLPKPLTGSFRKNT